ncbi:hypothetical protein E4U55_003874 [Claviceps digitariae]|nr:hypothetical protein E4U55_003874 [Claviceps digitariae]
MSAPPPLPPPLLHPDSDLPLVRVSSADRSAWMDGPPYVDQGRRNNTAVMAAYGTARGSQNCCRSALDRNPPLDNPRQICALLGTKRGIHQTRRDWVSRRRPSSPAQGLTRHGT